MWKSPRRLLCLSALIFVAGCSALQLSETQRAVRQARQQRDYGKDGDALTAVQSTLVERGVAHQRVKFRYDVTARPLLGAFTNPRGFFRQTPFNWFRTQPESREKSAIVFRDDAHQAHPWWYVDAKVRRPIWLPNMDVEGQIRYATRRRVELLQVDRFDPTLREMEPAATEEATEPSTTVKVKTSAGNREARFRKVHGTDYNPLSPVDVAKMRKLRGK